MGFSPDEAGERKLWGFTMTLGYSRRLFAAAATVKITKRGCTGKSFRLGEGRLLGTESHKARQVASTDTLLLLVVLSFPSADFSASVSPVTSG